MVVFRKKNIITTKSIGEDLQRARRALNLSLEAIERRIGIGRRYLEALENNEFETVPGEVYAKNWLVKYVHFLGLNQGDILKKYEREVSRFNFWGGTAGKKAAAVENKLRLFPQMVKRVIFACVLVVIVGYVGSHIYSLLSPPKLKVLYPADNFVGANRSVKILGETGQDVFWLGLNDKEVAVGDDGFFSVDIDLNKGLNVIKLEARKSYGRSSTVYRRIVIE